MSLRPFWVFGFRTIWEGCGKRSAASRILQELSHLNIGTEGLEGMVVFHVGKLLHTSLGCLPCATRLEVLCVHKGKYFHTLSR